MYVKTACNLVNLSMGVGVLTGFRPSVAVADRLNQLTDGQLTVVSLFRSSKKQTVLRRNGHGREKSC